MKRYEPTAVYLMRNHWSSANYKVGVSKNPSRRVAEVEQQYGTDCEILGTCWFPYKYDARQAEKIWHKKFTDFLTDDHGGREWFSLNGQAVEEFKNWCKLSKPDHDFKRWLFMAAPSTAEVKSLLDGLFRGIPKKIKVDSIDVWTYTTVYPTLL